MTNLLKHAVLAVAFCAGTSAGAATLSITVTNTSAPGGFAITPLWAAFHNGSFTQFTLGSPATAGVERIAELGDPSGLQPELLAADSGATATVLAAAGNGIPPIEAGESASVQITLNSATQRFFSFLSMLVPSNDTFIGNENALEVFDAGGNFLGPRTINLTGLDIYDAGTEADDPAGGPAFVVGQDATLGGPDVGFIRLGQSLSAFAGVTVPGGTLLDGSLIDFTSDPANFALGRIEISQVPSPIPLPATAPLLVCALAASGMLLRRRRPQS